MPVEYRSFTTNELMNLAEQAKARAHDAPKGGDAWARHSREWMALADEIDRRARDTSTPR